MKLLLESFVYEIDVKQIIQNWCFAHGIPVIKFIPRPFTDEKFETIGMDLTRAIDGDVFPIGSCKFVQWIAEKKGINSWFGDWCKISECIKLFNDVKIHEKYEFKSFKDLSDHQQRLQIQDSYGDENGNIFIRPDSGFKTFDGQLIRFEENDDCCPAFEFIKSLNIDPEERILISKPVKIHSEYRSFLSDTRRISTSYYRLNGKFHPSSKDIPQKVLDFVDDCGKRLPGIDCVIDVAILIDGSCRVVEIGSPNMAGFYDCNVVEILRSMILKG